MTVDIISWQSFVIAVLAIVIATFSTGIDSQCFQVLLINIFRIWLNSSVREISNIKSCSLGKMRKRQKMMYHMVLASSILFLPQEPCILLCFSLVGTVIIPWKSEFQYIVEFHLWRHIIFSLIQVASDNLSNRVQVYNWCWLDQHLGQNSKWMAGCLSLW